MYFEGKELKPYAESISVAELKEGSVYFSVTFADNDMLIPVVNTIVFVGKNDEGLLQFQDVSSHQHGVRYRSASDDDCATFFQCSADQLQAIFEYEHALDVLMRCSLRRLNKT